MRTLIVPKPSHHWVSCCFGLIRDVIDFTILLLDFIKVNVIKESSKFNKIFKNNAILFREMVPYKRLLL